MGLLPTTGDDLDLVRFQIATQPGYTHKLDIDQQWSGTPGRSIPGATVPSCPT